MYKKIRFLLQWTIQERYNYLSPTRLILTVCTLPFSDQFLSRALQRKTLWEIWLQKWLPGYTVVQNDFSRKDCVVPKNIHTLPPTPHGGHYCFRPPHPLGILVFVRPGIPTWLGTQWKEYFRQKCSCAIKSNLSTTDTLGTEESGRCRGVLNKSQCLDFLSAGRKKKRPLQRGGR